MPLILIISRKYTVLSLPLPVPKVSLFLQSVLKVAKFKRLSSYDPLLKKPQHWNSFLRKTRHNYPNDYFVCFAFSLYRFISMSSSVILIFFEIYRFLSFSLSCHWFLLKIIKWVFFVVSKTWLNKELEKKYNSASNNFFFVHFLWNDYSCVLYKLILFWN